MRHGNRVLLGAAVAVGAIVATSCLFSTTPPKPSGSSSGDETDPEAVVVTGLVQLFDRTDHHSRTMPGWLVRANWYVLGGAGQPPRLAHVEIAYSGRDGVYHMSYKDPYLVRVEVMARICVVDLDGMDCCLDDPPCNLPECTTIWTTPVRIDVAPGARERRTLTVGCQHVP